MNVRGWRSRPAIGVAATAAALVLASCSGTDQSSERDRGERESESLFERREEARGEERRMETAGQAGGESFEALTAASQFAEARSAPTGLVNPADYETASVALAALPATGGAWSHVTGVPYDSDDTRYIDYIFGNSGGGSGLVTGRVTGLAADDQGWVYAAAADGGVWRRGPSGGWVSISDHLPTLSSGDLQLVGGTLWFATGEANTGASSFVGAGVYALANPRTGQFTLANRVGGIELYGHTINALRWAGGKVWAATGKGLYSHSATADATPWKLEFAPTPAALSQSTSTNAPYQNIINDLVIDPRNPNHLIAAAGWRSGAAYNGFYENLNVASAGSPWTKVNLGGGIPADDVGTVSIAYSADGAKLYAINQSPKLLNKATGNTASLLDGVYVSNSGKPTGPWTKIADSKKLANSGSALKQSIGGKGYGPGVQSWYNQFLAVDPADANHVYVGLEEVYETRNGGSTWKTVGPYWNFEFGCWNLDPAKNTCPLTTHPDQHAVAFGSIGGKKVVYVGNDGGVYRRPVTGQENAEGHATDWTSLNDGTMDALQYYAVGVGRERGGITVSGGLQDNGGSILRAGESKMGSNFGGDGGDVLVDPANGCNIVQEYVFLSMEVTNTCGDNPTRTPGGAIRDIAPPDSATGEARFIAPFAADDANLDVWLAGGRHVWVQRKGFAIQKGSEWSSLFDLGVGHAATAVAARGDRAYVAWCGPCNNNGFTRGIAVGNPADPTSWHQVTLPSVPNRYLAGLGIDPNDNRHAFVAVNGFNRQWTEGPGAGVGHLYETRDGGETWTDVSGNLPDVPANEVVVRPDGTVVLATDLGVVVRRPGAASWQRLGANLPLATALDLEAGPDGQLYVATHGRGIWKIATP